MLALRRIGSMVAALDSCRTGPGRRLPEAGYVWVNEVARHFLGAAFGGYKQSGTGREEGLDELLDFTQQKNIHIRYGPG